ncbi:dTDP-4-dehydrorhamnose 3,5-epimerase [Hyphomonas sp.]|uniref:dTDP-4-dehydrorhamnose 3,5-epimerase n=1 Tax=Hyphomonas sp. TaxID=87 RepID=UPI0035289884
MEIRDLGLEGVKEIIPARFRDARGYFTESYNRARFIEAGIDLDWMQDNLSFSADQYVLRGLHFQKPPFAQDKLVRVITGAVFDVAVDIREGSPTYGKWTSVTLSAEKGNQILVPKGFAHGFLTLTPDVHVAYKVTAPYAPDQDRSVRYDDPAIGVDWPLNGAEPKLSAKDAAAKRISETPTGFVYGGELAE